MKKLLLVACILLAACQPELIRPPEREEQKINIDERLLQPCVPLDNIKDNPQPTDVLKQHGADVRSYKACAESKQKLIEVVRKAFQGI